jgi:hypothetical protein
VKGTIAALLLAMCSHAMACGFHDEVSLQRGVLNWVYPESLHVRAAVWRAQQAGQIEREELPYLKVAFLLRALQPHLAANTSVVLLTPMLWTRYSSEGVRVHAEGSAQGDAVLVTEAAVVKAIVEQRLTLADALAGGVLRIYPAH